MAKNWSAQAMDMTRDEKVKDDKSVSDQKKLAAQTAWSVADAKLQSLLATLAVTAKGLARRIGGVDNPVTGAVVWWAELLGAVAVPLNYRLSGAEVAVTLNDCTAQTLIFEDHVSARVERARLGGPSGATTWVNSPPRWYPGGSSVTTSVDRSWRSMSWCG